MAYATQSELTDRLGDELLVQLADEDGDGTADAAIVTAALDDASAEMDLALAGRYATPVASPPAILTRLATDLAAYHLFLRKRGAVTPEHAERREQARALLREIAEGKIDLAGAAARLGSLESECTTREQDKRFDRESLESF